MRALARAGLSGAAALAVAALLAACGEAAAPAEAAPAPPPSQVLVVTLKSAPLTLTRELSGRVQARLVAEVRPQVGGIVRQRRFAEGSDVRAGQALYELDDAAYRAQHDSAQAQLRKAQASLNYARLVAKRSRELVRMAAVSAQDNDKMIAAEAQAEAELGVAQAALASSAVSLAHARITAPIAGRIGKSSVTQGALVSADQAMPLATIQQLDPIYLELNQSSGHWLALKQAIDAGRVKADRAGAAVRIVLEDGSAYPHEGKLQFSDVTVDPATGNILLRATVPNPKLVLLPGMFVRAVVSEGAVAQAVLVPQQGVTRNPDGNASALVVDAGGKVESRTVRLSRSVGNQWLVDEGLAAGDRVIVEGVQKAKPGAQVQAVEQDPARMAEAGHAVHRR